MSAHSVSSIAGELKYATLASWVEKAPRPTAEKQWHTASSQDMPASRSAMMPTAVMAQYTSHSDFAVPVMRGVILSSFIGPGVSALYSCMPPTPSSGSTATASTMMPSPPNQCSVQRQTLMAGAR